MPVSFREEWAKQFPTMTEGQKSVWELEGLRLHTAELVYESRTRAGMSQKQLAEKVGTGQSVISAFESGARIPSLPMLAKISGATSSHLSIELVAQKQAS